jgi:hypothetical protein
LNVGIRKLLILGVATAFVTALAAGVPLASAATVTPESLTNCTGGVSLDTSPTSDDPNLLDYQFQCDTDITGYSVLINRPGKAFTGIDDFSSTANVFLPTGDQVTTEQFTCSGTTPGDGINCNAGAGGFGSAGTTISGTVDTVDPFCSSLPAHAKPGTKPEPAAIAQLIVSDNTGAEDGPFKLWMKPLCKPVKPAPKPAAKKSVKKSTKKSAKKSKHERNR